MPLRRGRLLALFLVTLTPIGCVIWPEGTGPEASSVPLAEALQRRERGEAVLIDVRSPEAYAGGHVPGALNITSSEIEGRAAEIRGMGRLPILYCG
jgi:Rhodanese-like domain